MKKRIHLIRVIILIVVFSLLIILPPLFRLLFPKVEEAVSVNKDRITLLTCTKDYPNEQISVDVQVRYINAKIEQTRLVYKTYVNADTVFNTTLEDELRASDEIAYFSSIPGIHIENLEDRTIVIIDQDVIDSNPNNVDLKNNYFNDQKTSQRIYFTNLSYSCDETTS